MGIRERKRESKRELKLSTYQKELVSGSCSCSGQVKFVYELMTVGVDVLE